LKICGIDHHNTSRGRNFRYRDLSLWGN